MRTEVVTPALAVLAAVLAAVLIDGSVVDRVTVAFLALAAVFTLSTFHLLWDMGRM